MAVAHEGADNLVDNFGVPLEVTTVAFTIALAVTFAVWKSVEGTLSIHTIYTDRREGFYWLAILFTFALGTAVGDLIAETFSFGYLTTAILFLGVIALIAAAYYFLRIGPILAFWLAYIFTRPLGASFAVATTGTSPIVSTLKLYLHGHVMRPSPRAGASLRDRDARRQRALHPISTIRVIGRG